MRSTLNRLRVLAIIAVLALVAVACGEGDEPVQAPTDGEATETEAAAGEPVEGGTVVFGAEQEPDILNPLLSEGNLVATSRVVTPVLQAAYRIRPDFTYEPELIDGDPELTEDPFTLTYRIKDEAAWADGTPVTADDFQFTLDTIMNEEWDITSRDGYDKITETEIIDDKTWKVTFSEPYAPWKTLFSTSSGSVLPKHELEGEDFNTVWNDGVTLGSGPFVFESWDKGQQLTLTKNENYWGETKPKLDQIVFRFIEDSQTMVQQFRGREIDAFDPQPQLDLVEQVDQLDDATLDTGLGPVWEHLDYNHTRSPLDQQYVRAAIAYGIDRQAIVDQIVQPLMAGTDETVGVLQNVIYVENQDEYEPHFDTYGYDPEQAQQLLEDNGCEQGDDGVYTCEGERLSFGFTFTAGNEARQLQFEIIQAQLQEIGIEITDDSGEASVVFGDDVLLSQNYDLFAFAWVGSPDPAGGNTIWICEGDLNYTGYCNEEVTDLIGQTDRELDAQARADLYNQADALMAEDLPVLPLYQKPSTLIWYEDIVGMENNTTQQGVTWNTEEWALTE